MTTKQSDTPAELEDKVAARSSKSESLGDDDLQDVDIDPTTASETENIELVDPRDKNVHYLEDEVGLKAGQRIEHADEASVNLQEDRTSMISSSSGRTNNQNSIAPSASRGSSNVSETIDVMESVNLQDDAPPSEKASTRARNRNTAIPPPSSRISSTESPTGTPASTTKFGSAFAGYAASLMPSASHSSMGSAQSSGTKPESQLTPIADHTPLALTGEGASTTTPKGTSWKSSLSSYFGRPTPPPANEAAFIINKLDATLEDRRRSMEAGGSDALKEEFERAKRDSASRMREAAAFGDESFEEEDDEPCSTGRHTRNHSTQQPKTPQLGQESHMDEPIPTDGVDWPFWGLVMNDYEGIARSRPADLSVAIQRGIPAVIRGTIWQLMSSSKSSELESVYASLLKAKSPHEKAIQKDMARTLPGHRYFAQGGGVGQEHLFNVVKAYSLHDTVVGYTQGLAFIVAALLLNMPDEEAFCVLVRLMESVSAWSSHQQSDRSSHKRWCDCVSTISVRITFRTCPVSSSSCFSSIACWKSCCLCYICTLSERVSRAQCTLVHGSSRCSRIGKPSANSTVIWCSFD